ncbi:DUF4344 domain-containing metallopeptidase [Nonomuraea sp. NPDC046570]|uniref:DUF4344 domain-containing metallopeptidase n=1 Tax=Nonomuraea sp. NPDC046570 TaxID=3155255 RepID=UPI0033C2139E
MLHHLLAGSTALVLGLPAQAATGDPVQVRYERPGSSSTAKAALLLRESGVLRTRLRLPDKVTVVAKDCGAPKASWDHERRRITFCYELVKQLSKTLTGIAETEETLDRRHDTRVDAALAVLFHHQLGHAATSLYGMRSPSAEALPDRFAALTLTAEYGRQPKTVIAAAEARHLLGSNAPLHHLGGPTESATFACHLYGASPKAHGRIASAGWLPADRAPGCAQEYSRLKTDLGGYVD